MPAALPILVVDDDAVSRKLVADSLDGAGLGPVVLAEGPVARRWLEQNVPRLLLLDNGASGVDTAELVRWMRQSPTLEHASVVIAVAADSPEQTTRAFAAGADDVLTKPFNLEELMARVRRQLTAHTSLERLHRREYDLHAVVELTQALTSSLDIRDILYTVARRIAEIVEVERCSIVLAHESSDVGYVVASSDDEQLRDLPIRLEKYPEIREVLASRLPLIIGDTDSHQLMEVVRQSEPTMEFRSLALSPIVHEQQSLGVIFLRTRRQSAFEDEEMALVQTLANTAAVAIRNARIMQSLRDESQQSAEARLDAERRMRLFQRYADFFESAADGMVVADHAGHVLFANPRAREITDMSEIDIAKSRMVDLLCDSEHERAQRLIRGFRHGIYPQAVDIKIKTPSGETKILSVNFSSVLRAEKAVLFTFRDVTAERETAIELKQTKEFLEKVIDSSVDAIVSADTRGQVVLFNRAAARIFGYSPDDVIGKMNVEELYPPGVAKEVMRKIREDDYGGKNRLEEHRVAMLGSQGEHIPVDISAALILENGESIGSVGIFHDVREHLRMEARLMKAQEDLRYREKGAAVAALAGATAHELNQPLTSIIGYAEFLARHTEKDSRAGKAAQVIMSEAERMAEIVRKIGKITHYETKTYVGGAQILDIDKAVDDRTGAIEDRDGKEASQ